MVIIDFKYSGTDRFKIYIPDNMKGNMFVMFPNNGKDDIREAAWIIQRNGKTKVVKYVSSSDELVSADVD